MLKFNEGQENEITARVVLESEAYGREYHDQYETLDDALAGIKRMVLNAAKHDDGVERVIGIVLVPKEGYGDESGYGYGLEPAE